MSYVYTFGPKLSLSLQTRRPGQQGWFQDTVICHILTIHSYSAASVSYFLKTVCRIQSIAGILHRSSQPLSLSNTTSTDHLNQQLHPDVKFKPATFVGKKLGYHCMILLPEGTNQHSLLPKQLPFSLPVANSTEVWTRKRQRCETCCVIVDYKDGLDLLRSFLCTYIF